MRESVEGKALMALPSSSGRFMHSLGRHTLTYSSAAQTFGF
jgi:hypothetical protein